MVGSALGIALSGLTAQAQKLASSATNVANALTTGFKKQQTNLSARAGDGGGGVSARNTTRVDQPGFLFQTSSRTDAAISGNGFFAVQNPSTGETLFTRAGSFSQDSQGFLRNGSGFRLLGFAPNSGTLEPVNISNSPALSQATSNVDVNLNLDSDQPLAPTTPGPHFSRSVSVFDSLGTEQQIELQFTHTSVAPNQFELNILDSSGNQLTPTQTLEFDGTGQLTSSGTVSTTGIDFGNGSNLQNIDFDISGITQFSGGFSVASIDQNGTGAGNLTSVSITDRGTIRASFSNGQEADLFTVPVATFINPNGLQQVSGTAFRETQDSGTFALNSGGAGSIVPSTLESSNVDLAEEAVNQITASTAYRANLKVIKAADEQLGSLLDIFK